MKGDKRAGQPPSDASIPGRILGSLRDALAAASRDATQEPAADERTELLPRDGPAAGGEAPRPASVEVSTRTEAPSSAAQGKSAAEALRDAKAPPPHPAESPADPTTRAVRGSSRGKPAARAVDPARTQVVRGKPKVTHGEFHQDPVVGWLVVVGGPGLGAFRPIYEGNNAIGRGSAQRIAIDFGDNTISSEEQAYIRYDSADRSFLFVPNLAKTNIVAVNNKRPTGAVKLEPMDMITMGRTQLAFVPFCGEDFDWSELDEIEG